MNIGLLNILKTIEWDFRHDMAQNYANALKNAMEQHLPNVEKSQGFFLSKKGSKTVLGNFEDKMYVGNIHRIESNLYWNDEELADDDQIVNVVVIQGPVTRDGGACAYGTKDFRDQVEYANTIPQVVGHIFIVNTPGGESACRNDYDEIFRSCREANKPTVWYVDGMCCSSGVNGGCRADRVIVRNPKDDFGCIGSMAAFWATPDGAIDRDGTRFVSIVGEDCPEKNDWYFEAAKGNYEKLREIINKDTREFHQTVRENRPLVEDWMLSGNVFEAQKLIPALVDEIGDFNRAIECVFELADGRMQSSRGKTEIDEPGQGNGEQPGGEPEEMAKLNAQQKAAIATSRGGLMKVDNGHVITEVQGFFGPETVEIAKPKNNNDMTDEEKKAQEAEAAQAAQETTPVEEQPAEEASPETEAPAVNDETPAESEAPAQGDGGTDPGETPQEDPGQTPETADELAQAKDALHTAEAIIAERDAQISSLKETMATLDGIADERDAAIKERDEISASLDKAGTDYEKQGKALIDAESKIAEHVATIEKLKKQIAELQNEVKELSGEPAPMVDAKSGVPADNGAGEAPKQKQGITFGMTYEQIRAQYKKG